MNVFDGIVFRLRSQILGFARPCLVIGDNHAAAAGGYDLVPIEAKAGNVTERSNHSVLVSRTQTLSRVFNDHQVVLSRDFQDRIQIN